MKYTINALYIGYKRNTLLKYVYKIKIFKYNE